MDSTSCLLCDIFSARIECEKLFICLYQTVLHHYFYAFDPIFHSRVLWKKECIIIFILVYIFPNESGTRETSQY